MLRPCSGDKVRAFCNRTNRHDMGIPLMPASHNDATVTDITHQLPLIFILKVYTLHIEG